VIDGAGIFTHVEIWSYNPMDRKVEDVADVAEFFASDLSANDGCAKEWSLERERDQVMSATTDPISTKR
jgi:hypothetical protein